MLSRSISENSITFKYVNICLLLLFLINLNVQLHYFSPYLDNQIINGYQPGANDAIGYAALAQHWNDTGSFSDTFKDGVRLPGYPSVIALFIKFFDSPFFMLRVFQIMLLATSALLTGYILKRLKATNVVCVLGALLVSSWPAFYYFSPILYAEGISIVLSLVLFACLVKVGESNAPWYNLVILGFALAGLIYLKPNHLFFVIPMVFYLIYKNNLNQALFKVGIPIIISFTLMIPWMFYLSSNQGKFIPLSLTNGINFLEGTGDYGRVMNDSLPGKYSNTNELYKDCLNWHCIDYDNRYSRVESEKIRNKGLSIWLDRPLQTAKYGFMKVLHSHGFSFRHIGDHAEVMLLILSVISAIYLWRNAYQKRLIIYYMAILGAAALQSFIFLPDQRFKVVMFDFPALLLVALFLYLIMSKIGVRTTTQQVTN